jgi:hypothetical protein
MKAYESIFNINKGNSRLFNNYSLGTWGLDFQ